MGNENSDERLGLMNRRLKIALRYVGGKFEPAGPFAQQQVADKRFREGQIVGATLTKSRSPGFNRLAHQLGALCAENLDAFAGMDAHAVLKRLQWESNVGCTTMGVRMAGVGFVEVRMPESLSFDAMDQDEFRAVVRGLCRYIVTAYWPSCTPEEIERMASCMVGE